MARRSVSDYRPIPTVTSLPASPVDGMVVNYKFTQTVQPAAASVRFWQLMWDSTTSLWYPIGDQAPVLTIDTVLQNIAFGANAWGTTSPTISANAPLQGTYRVEFGVPQLWNSSATGNWYVGILLSGTLGNRYPGGATSTTVNNTEAATGASTGSYSGAHGMVNFTLTSPTYMNCFLYEYFTASTTAYTGGRYIKMFPTTIIGN